MRWKVRAGLAGAFWVAAFATSYAIALSDSEWAYWARLIATFAAVAFTLRAVSLAFSPWTFIRALWFAVAIYVLAVILFCASFAIWVAARSNAAEASVARETVNGVAVLAAMALFLVGLKYIGAAVGLWLVESGKRQGIDRSAEVSAWRERFRAEFRRPPVPAPGSSDETAPSPPNT